MALFFLFCWLHEERQGKCLPAAWEVADDESIAKDLLASCYDSQSSLHLQEMRMLWRDTLQGKLDSTKTPTEHIWFRSLPSMVVYCDACMKKWKP